MQTAFSAARALRVAAGAAPRALHTTARASAADAAPAAAAAAAAGSELVLNFAVPAKPLVFKKVVTRVTLPGRDGTFGLEKNSPPLLSELKPGVVRVDYPDATSDEFFVPGGFVFKHPNNVLDVSAPESVRLDQVDGEALKAANAEAQKKKDASAAGSKEHAEAQLVLETYRILAQSAKVTL